MSSKDSTLARSHLFTQTNHTINYVARNTSCSRGWLRLVVQTIFGAITVASFILIIMMSLQRSPQSKSSCSLVACKVTCSDGNYKDNDIIAAVLEAHKRCDKIRLVLIEPTFKEGILPHRWLSNLPVIIDELSILGGNLRHISANAFKDTFATFLKYLLLENITIAEWNRRTLIGLSSLETIIIRESVTGHLENSVLEAIEDTIRIIVITKSGSWDPASLTGTSNLSAAITVDFSKNRFGQILGKSSFSGLEFCQNLHLNACNITAIGAGTFDPLKHIKQLFLYDNLLTTISPELFYNILNTELDHKVSIHLQNNPWYCNCSQTHILELSEKKLLAIDPVCRNPENFTGLTFSTLKEHCKNDTLSITPNYNITGTIIEFVASPKCHGSDDNVNASIEIKPPLSPFACGAAEMSNFNRARIEMSIEEVNNCSWLQPSLLIVHKSFSMMQIDAIEKKSGVGLLWFHSQCPNEVYCFKVIPDLLRLYNINFNAKYTFCPIDLQSALVETDHCVYYNLSNDYVRYEYLYRPLLYVVIGIICLLLGASFVYGIVRFNPYLLKGSKRLLFVKHRSVDALVLPPKVPIRNSLDSVNGIPVHNEIYTVSSDMKLLHPDNFIRSNSVRSDKSSSPTYISAMQPTEAQLAEWRIRHHFDKNTSIISITSEISNDFENHFYDTTLVAYESLN